MSRLAFLLAAVAALSLGGQAASAATVSQSFNPVLQADASSGTYSFVFAPSMTISDVNITLDFTKCDNPISSTGACQGTGYSYNREIVFSLISPSGTIVQLVTQDTYTGQTPGDRVQVTFDDAATTLVGGSTLSSGSFQPIGSLSSFNGEDSAGTWSIFYQDTVGADPMSLNGFTLAVNGPNVVPLPAGLPLLVGALTLLGGVAARRRRMA